MNEVFFLLFCSYKPFRAQFAAGDFAKNEKRKNLDPLHTGKKKIAHSLKHHILHCLPIQNQISFFFWEKKFLRQTFATFFSFLVSVTVFYKQEDGVGK